MSGQHDYLQHAINLYAETKKEVKQVEISKKITEDTKNKQVITKSEKTATHIASV